MILNDTRVAASDRCRASQLGSETVVLDAEAGEYWSLDPISSRIWQLIQKPRSFRALVAALLEEYDVPPERCEQEVRGVLERMAKDGLVQIERPESQTP